MLMWGILKKLQRQKEMHIFVEQKSRKPLTLTMLVLSYAVMYAHTTLTNVSMLNAILGKCLEK